MPRVAGENLTAKLAGWNGCDRPFNMIIELLALLRAPSTPPGHAWCALFNA
jgi:hypothetical protein